jgi:hypothetical protein
MKKTELRQLIKEEIKEITMMHDLNPRINIITPSDLTKKIENIIYDEGNDKPYAAKRIVKMLKEMGLI